MRNIKLVASVAAVMLALSAQAENEVELSEILVEGDQAKPSLTTPSIEASQEKLDAVPGGTTLIDAEQFRNGAVRDIADSLRLTPGVYAQSRFGSDETRLSIRGSGISLTFNTRGIRLLRDGLPLNEADGNFRPQLLEPLVAQHIEIYRGANALEFGAATLGGAINIVSPNARTVEGFTQRLELGSDDYRRFQLTNSKVIDDHWDVYGSLTGITQNGFRDNAEQDTLRFYANAGYQWDSGSETRIHLDIQDNNLELPGSLTRDQLEADPSQANPGSELVNSQRDFDLYRISAQHSVPLANGGKADFGLSFQHLDFFHPLRFALLLSDQNDTTASARVEQPIGEHHNLIYGALASWGESNDARSSNFGLAAGVPFNQGPITERGDSRSYGLELFVQDTININDTVDVIVGTQAVFARRESSELDLRSSAFGEREENYAGLSPRLGLIWAPTENAQYFTNLSRSFEAPTASAFAVDLDNTTEGILDEQIATTFEVGTRGTLRNMNYELALYYSNIEDEILTVENPRQDGDTITSNADDTVHKGAEFGVSGALTPWLNMALAYTYNNFKFDNDSLFGSNELPSIPRNFANAEFTFHNQSGFNIGPTIQYADSHYVDFSNTVGNDAYVIYGLKASYQINDQFKVFLEARNLEDETFASNTSTAANLNGDANGGNGLFNPGIDRSFFTGIEIKL